VEKFITFVKVFLELFIVYELHEKFPAVILLVGKGKCIPVTGRGGP
jgi:hypothetical protein